MRVLTFDDLVDELDGSGGDVQPAAAARYRTCGACYREYVATVIGALRHAILYGHSPRYLARHAR